MRVQGVSPNGALTDRIVKYLDEMEGGEAGEGTDAEPLNSTLFTALLDECDQRYDAEPYARPWHDEYS